MAVVDESYRTAPRTRAIIAVSVDLPLVYRTLGTDPLDNSDEPHLHVHAQRPGRIWDLFVGDPLPVTFNGRYLIRNDRIAVFEAPEEIDD